MWKVKTLIAGLLVLLAANATYAQSPGSGIIKIIVPFAPGGSTDTVARMIAAPLGMHCTAPL
jgi:tripartite-type tricarboxylate transporter receptor subunit TctC